MKKLIIAAVLLMSVSSALAGTTFRRCFNDVNHGKNEQHCFLIKENGRAYQYALKCHDEIMGSQVVRICQLVSY